MTSSTPITLASIKRDRSDDDLSADRLRKRLYDFAFEARLAAKGLADHYRAGVDDDVVAARNVVQSCPKTAWAANGTSPRR